MALHGTAIHCPTLHRGIVSCYVLVCKPGLGFTLTAQGPIRFAILLWDIPRRQEDCRQNSIAVWLDFTFFDAAKLLRFSSHIHEGGEELHPQNTH
jgi:hypothetical protein